MVPYTSSKNLDDLHQSMDTENQNAGGGRGRERRNFFFGKADILPFDDSTSPYTSSPTLPRMPSIVCRVKKVGCLLRQCGSVSLGLP